MRRGWFIAAVVVGIAAVVIAAVAMRLSDDGGTAQPSATEWADSVCSSFATWKESISSLADVSGGTLTADTLNQKIDSGKEATQTLVTDLKDLGPPDLESGQQAKEQLTSDVNAIQSTFDQVQQQAKQATEGGTLSLQALAPLVPQFQALMNATSKTIDDLQNADVAQSDKAELQSAFADAESCKQLKSSG